MIVPVTPSFNDALAKSTINGTPPAKSSAIFFAPYEADSAAFPIRTVAIAFVKNTSLSDAALTASDAFSAA